MQAHARVAAEAVPGPNGRATSRVCQLRSSWPLMLRRTLALDRGPIVDWANSHTTAPSVYLAAGGAGPVGGDGYVLQVRVGPGSALILSEVSPTLLLPGPTGAESSFRIDIEIAEGGSLAWLPNLVIAAACCRHRTDVHIRLEMGARLLLREQTLFGRHGEASGTLHQRTRIEIGNHPLYDQELAAGPDVRGWDGPAVTAGSACLGSLLLIDADTPWNADGWVGDDCALMRLPGPGVLLSALAADTGTLRRRLDAALDRVLR